MQFSEIFKSRGALIAFLIAFLFLLVYTLQLVGGAPQPLLSSREDMSGGVSSSPSVGIDSKDMIVPPIYNEGGATKPEDQKIIKTAQLSISVEDFETVTDKVKAYTAKVGGVVTGVSDSKDSTVNRYVTISIKVPNDQFDNAIKEIKAYGVDVISATENSSDVAMTYMDLESRLKSAKELEKTYLSLLNKTEKVSEVLEVQRELSTVRQNVEYLTSQIEYYNSMIDMSTITVTMELSSTGINIGGEPLRVSGVFKEASMALVELLKGFVVTFIWVVVFSPVVIIPVAIYKVVRKIKR